jgi:hypothetical protein
MARLLRKKSVLLRDDSGVPTTLGGGQILAGRTQYELDEMLISIGNITTALCYTRYLGFRGTKKLLLYRREQPSMCLQLFMSVNRSAKDAT